MKTFLEEINRKTSGAERRALIKVISKPDGKLKPGFTDRIM
jgi:hypothetical protein